MIAIIERLAVDLRSFAPELVCEPENVDVPHLPRHALFGEQGAVQDARRRGFPTRGLPKHEGAGLYFHVSPDEVWVGGGMYAPQTPQLHAVREHIAAHVKRLRTIVESPAFQQIVRRARRRAAAARAARVREGPSGGGVPEIPAVPRRRASWPSSFATSPNFYRTVLNVFRHAAPLVRFLNDPLAEPLMRGTGTPSEMTMGNTTMNEREL